MLPPRSLCFSIALCGSLFSFADCMPGAVGAPVPSISLTAEEVADGWISLFDGQSLFGWQPNSDMNWSVADGTITADRGHPGLLVTTFELADYEFRCEYRLAKGGNSGIFLRTPVLPKDPSKDCYELNMCDSHPAFPTGSIVGRKKADRPLAGEGEWISIAVRCEGPRVTARFNGQPAIDFTDHSPAARRVGRIGLQMNGGAVAFRKIALRPLATQDLFNGRDLTGWHPVPGSKSEFNVQDGTIHVINGGGLLESDATFADFVLQFDARTNGSRLNSGIFFRAMPGTQRAPSNGYELQIHNGFKNGNRSEPVDAGTGAIYRRTKARWVLPNDGEWFTATLIANQGHFAAWINGLQVTNWTDTRPDDPNPRRGRRLEAGRLSLQGHDRTTDLNFRKLRAAAIPAQ